MVGICDSGLDYNNCYFEDDDGLDVEVVNGKDNTFDSHRKVV